MKSLRHHIPLLVTALTVVISATIGGPIAQAQDSGGGIFVPGNLGNSASIGNPACATVSALAASPATFYYEYPLSALCVGGISTSDPLAQITYQEPNNIGIFSLLSGSQVTGLLGNGNYYIPIPTASNQGAVAGTWTLQLQTKSGVTYNIPYMLTFAPATGTSPSIGARCAGTDAILTLGGFAPGQAVTVILVSIPLSVDPKIPPHKSTVEANETAIPGKPSGTTVTVLDTLNLTAGSNGILLHDTAYTLNINQSFYFALYNSGSFPKGTFENNPYIARYPVCSV